MPESWEWVRLSSVINVVSAKRVHKSDWRNSGIPFYRAREIGKLAEFGSVDNDLFITEELYKQYSENGIPKPNDLMVTAVGTLGKTYVVKQDDKFYYKDASVLCFENFSKINPKFFQRIMETSFMKKQIMDQAMGTTVATLTISRANQYFVPIPPSNEQSRILKRIEHGLKLVAEYSANYSQLETSNKLFPDKLRKSILQYAMQGKLVPQDPNDEPVEVLLEKIRQEKQKLYEEGKLKKKDLEESIIYKGEDNSYYANKEKITNESGVPKGWKLIYFKDYLNLISGRDLKSSDFQENNLGKVPYLTGATNFSNGKIMTSRSTNFPSVLSIKDDLLITVKGTVGEMAYNPFEKAHIARQIMAIRSFEKEKSLSYMRYFLESELERIQSKAQSMIPGISREVLLSLIIPLPPQPEQIRIIRKLDIINQEISSLKIVK
ncbi:restriction endonuclease subunit S [Lactococcus garvieae]|uniref:restriction endonuclease subunit S n=1 Tax=Lactococcus garvieae TaxID=1363 RepID=UPI003D7729AE